MQNFPWYSGEPLRAVLFQLLALAVVYALALTLTPLVCFGLGRQQPDNARTGELDGLRGLAAVGVVACHVNQYVFGFLNFTMPPLFGNHAGILGVQMFFSLTAYLFVRQALAARLTPETFYIGRIRRILPLYISVCVAALLIATASSTEKGDSTISALVLEAIQVLSYGFWKTDTLVFQGVNMLRLIGVTWTLSYEWAFYLLLVPGYFLWRSGPLAKWVLAAGIGILAARDFHVQSEQVIWPFFLPGILAAAIVPPLPKFVRYLLALLAIPALALIFWLPGFWNWQKLALCTVLFLYVVHCHPTWMAWRPLRTLGLISYSIYLIQYLVLYPVSLFVFGGVTALPERLTLLALVPVVTIIVATFTYRWIEKPWTQLRAP